MKSSFLFLSLLFTLLSFSQVKVDYTLIDKKITVIPRSETQSATDIARYIDSNFKTEDDKIRAIFYWITSNISYDIANMYQVDFENNTSKRITKTLKTKKGICADYSMLFHEIASLTGIKSFVIEGYTKQNGKIDVLSHAWCAAKINNEWYLFDPTWGSGYVNNNKYTRKINNLYYKVAPSQMISSHIPFDYLWQFLTYPITNQEFINGKTQINKSKKKFDFISEISRYESLPKTDQLFGAATRIEQNGIKNQLISQAYAYTKTAWNNERENEITTKYNAIVTEFNEAINELNDFVYYRNNKFKPLLPDEEIKAKIQIPNDKFKKCQEALSLMTFSDPKNANNFNAMKKSVADALAESEMHLKFVNDYLSKSKLIRKTMFTKVSWFGIPLN